MKVCIVTVYDSVNSGSYWQAYALGSYLNTLGIEVYYLKRNLRNKIKIQFFKKNILFRMLIKQGFYSYKIQRKINKAFIKTRKNFKDISFREAKKLKIDYYILGSDTIWNFEDEYFYHSYSIFLGEKFKGANIISYAASSGNTSINTFFKIKNIKNIFNNIKWISVRDYNTKEVVSNFTNKEIVEVCDPTLLFDKIYYQKIAKKPIEEDFIYLYLFGDLTKEQQTEIKRFAYDNNLKIINGVSKKIKADEYVINTPYRFLDYMVNAKYVITDTFHGTIFSVNLEKNFVVIDRNKKKVNYFLNVYNFEDRLINNNSEITPLFDENKYPINYEKKIIKLDKDRRKSREFLNKIMEDINE